MKAADAVVRSAEQPTFMTKSWKADMSMSAIARNANEGGGCGSAKHGAADFHDKKLESRHEHERDSAECE